MTENEPGGWGETGAGGAAAGTDGRGFGEVPPVLPGALGGGASTASWPTVVGVISIVLGALGIAKNACGVVGNLVMGWMGMFSMSGGAKTPQMEQMEKGMAAMGPWVIAMAVLGVVSVGVSVLLLIAGIQLQRRRRQGVTLHKWWAWVRIVMVVAETVATAVMQVTMMSSITGSMPQGGGAGGAGPAAVMPFAMVFGAVSGCITALIGLAYPIVVLAVLTRPWAKSEIGRWPGGDGLKREW